MQIGAATLDEKIVESVSSSCCFRIFFSENWVQVIGDFVCEKGKKFVNRWCGLEFSFILSTVNRAFRKNRNISFLWR